MAHSVQKVKARAHSAAAPEQVWSLLADGAHWDRWARMSQSELVQPGDQDTDGIGAVRSFRTGRITTREEVIVFDPPRRFAYRLLSGMPVKDYRADIILAPADGGTDITWSAIFFPARRPLAPLLRVWIKIILTDYARRLARAAASGT